MVEGKTVLLFSGGLDSYCASKLIKPDVNLYINCRSRYADTELSNLPKVDNLVIDTRVDLSKQERNSALIPGRNAYFVLIAGEYGDTILLGSMLGDRTGDQDTEFTARMESLLNKIWEPQHWLPEGRKISVRAPFKTHTKTELVRKYLEQGHDPDILPTLVSCYSGRKACGACKPCARKWVALKLNGLEAEFEQDPSTFFDPYIKDMKHGRYRGPREDAEILQALALSGVSCTVGP